MTRCPPKSSYRVGDLQKLGDLATPDPDAEEKLYAVIELIWRAATSQREPSIHEGLVSLVSGFTEQRQAFA